MSRRKKVSVEAWSMSVGLLPFKVTVEERITRKGALYLRWWNADVGNWKVKSLAQSLARAGLGVTTLRDAAGVVIDTVAAWAVEQAWMQYRRLSGLAPADPAAGATAAPLTIEQAWAAITDHETGRYPTQTAYRDEVEAALTFAATVWGGDTAWSALGRADWTKLMRRRLEGLLADGYTGIRGTQVTITRLITVARWLRDEGHIPTTIILPREEWRDDVNAHYRAITKAHRTPAPNRPRYTDDETDKLFATVWAVEPRLALLVDLAAEYRLGQAVRSMRSDLVLEPTADAPHGQFHIHGSGDKRGEIVYLTPGQRASVERALTGYLRDAEARYLATGEDYCLFPSGRFCGLRGKRQGQFKPGHAVDWQHPLTRSGIDKRFRRLQKVAGVPPVKGRLWYGLRRHNVDAVLDTDISLPGLGKTGGWSDATTPTKIYAEQESSRARKEASETRARVRKEPATPPTVTEP